MDMMSNIRASASSCVVCGATLAAGETCVLCLLRAGFNGEQASADPARFGDFEIERRDDGSFSELGRGAMGVTYRAHDSVLNRTVALKVIEASKSQAVRERFLREARTAAALRHPNIAGVFQFGASADGARCYCAMELVEGETLEALVKREGPLLPQSVIEIAIQVTRALIAAADRGLVHRDLKPGNIMLASNEGAGRFEVKVIDFGLAKAVSAAGEMELTHGNFVGTPAFASPEQFARGVIDARTDIYALGVTMWFALTSRLPFPGTSIEEIRECQSRQALPLKQLRSGALSRALIELLCSCLSFNSAERPGSARELMPLLENCRARMTSRRRRHLLALAAFVIAIAIFAVAFWFSKAGLFTREDTAATLTNPIAPAKPTENARAYLFFLRAREAEINEQPIDSALPLYDQAIALDPKFALARARASICASMAAYETDNAALRRKARNEADDAIRLQPDLGEAHLALAHCYIAYRDPERALAELKRAVVLLPNSAEVHLATAWVFKQKNEFRERIAALRRAEAIDPRSGQVHSFLILTFRWVRDWRNAIDALDRRTIVSPNGSELSASRWGRANDAFRLSGDINALKEGLAQEEHSPAAIIPPERLNYERFEIAMLERDFTRARESLSKIPPDSFVPSNLFLSEVAGHQKPFYEALLAVASGADLDERRRSLVRAQNAFAKPRSHPRTFDEALPAVDLAIIDAFSGRKEEAIRTAQTAPAGLGGLSLVEINDLSSALALVYAQTGEPDKAIDLIEHLLTVPCQLQCGAIYNMTLVDLKWRWIWDPLRSNPRFQKLLAGPEPKTVY